MGPYRPIWVGIGQLTLGLTIVVLFSFYVRRRIGQPNWRRLHYLSFLAWLGATVHGLMAGTDTQATWVFAGYVVMSAIVAFLSTYRIVLSVSARRTNAVKPGAPAAERGASASGL